MLWDDQFDFSDVFSEVLVSSELKQSFVSSADGRFPNLRSSTVDPLLQLPSSRSNFKIVFTLLNDPQELETQTTLATYICGGILSTKPTTRRAYDSAPARLNRPSMGGEHAVVHLWRKFLGWRYHLRSLEMTCHTDVHPTFTMCLRVPPVMEELRLKFHEKECRLDIYYRFVNIVSTTNTFIVWRISLVPWQLHSQQLGQTRPRRFCPRRQGVYLSDAAFSLYNSSGNT